MDQMVHSLSNGLEKWENFVTQNLPQNYKILAIFAIFRNTTLSHYAKDTPMKINETLEFYL
jgi:alpha-ketoglutarate-dependent taurine dioxygenase